MSPPTHHTYRSEQNLLFNTMTTSFSYSDDSEVVRIIESCKYDLINLTVMTFKDKRSVVESVYKQASRIRHRLSTAVGFVHSNEHIEALCSELSLCFAVLSDLVQLIPESYAKRLDPWILDHINDWEAKENGKIYYTLLRSVFAKFGIDEMKINYRDQYHIEVYAVKHW